MDKLSLSSPPSPVVSRPFLSPLLPFTNSRRRVSFTLTKPKKFAVFASKNDPNDNNNLNQWDLMELKFGQMLGEDPKLTLAKIKGRKVNPDASYMDIEKSFYKNKGKIVEVKEVPFDVLEKPGSTKMANGLNLVKPVPKKGIKVGGGEDFGRLPDLKRPSESVRNKMSGVTKSNVPNVILRKPSVFNEKDDEMYNSSRLKIRPNLSLSMRTDSVKEKFSGMTLLKKPSASEAKESGGTNEDNVMDGSMYSGLVNKPESSFESDIADEGQNPTTSGEYTLLEKPQATVPQNTEEIGSTAIANVMDNMLENFIDGIPESEGSLISKQDGLGVISPTGMEHLEQTDAGYSGNGNGMSTSSVGSTVSQLSVESVLQGKPKRLDQSVREMSSYPIQEVMVSAYPESFDGEGVQEKLPQSHPLEETEGTAWTQVEQLFDLGDRVEVELISCSPRGFVVSFGSLIGFLPYRNLAAKWKFLAFESWLRRNGLDPSKYRQHLGIVGNDEVLNKSTYFESSSVPENGQKKKFEVSPDMELEDLLKIYDQEKIQYLSSYIGQHIRVNILLADRKSRKLIFSMRPKEKEETVEKKRSLMAKLSVGDVVKCCIKKITYFGIFVEVEGVPALIHQTEVSWDGTLDTTSYLKIGQIVEAKVHQLDFALERIFLSLKEITPDPLNEALECIVGGNGCIGGSNFSEADTEWAEVDTLFKELQAIEGVESVTNGRFFLSPGLAPTFQVYMASMFDNQYKLLARSGNKVQELMVQASLDKEEMKSAILKCTNRVEL
ncbi:uncharacterized protein LOC104892303 isoform X2 [Beta vulgaris subsp. vulgaris]|uniref:uncharacterized protein LOC104892303 isoform X2 n=1 Tax=Beta vulgaris subsp. vulgaris TaxID=3555 RepID=UPI002036AD6F|nr:uncharacterized protein LOC104892303 isoform X2 [Beta vulgaris subsp. vulgaris]